MNQIKQIGKNLRNTRKNSENTIRRVQENFPMIERKADFVKPENPYKMEFTAQSVPKSIRLNLYLASYDKPCEPEQLDYYVAVTANCPGYPPGEFEGAQSYNHTFTQIGGFVSNYPGPGIIVPLSGVYQIRFAMSTGGVAVGNPTYLIAGIMVNGALVITETYTPSFSGLGYYGPDVNLYTTMYLAAGSVVGGYTVQSGIAFWTPSNLCGLFGGSPTTIILVGLQ